VKFYLKLLRNTLIIAFGYFISNLVYYSTFSYDELRPFIIFVGFYIFSELVHKYSINQKIPRGKRGSTYVTLFF